VADRALLEQVAPSPTFITYTYPVHDQAPSVQLALGGWPSCLIPALAQPSRWLSVPRRVVCNAPITSSTAFMSSMTHLWGQDCSDLNLS